MKFQFEARDKSKLPFPKHKTTHKIQYVRMSQDTMVIQHGIPRKSLSTANVLFAKALSTVRQGSCMAGTGQGRMAAVLRRGTLALLVTRCEHDWYEGRVCKQQVSGISAPLLPSSESEFQ